MQQLLANLNHIPLSLTSSHSSATIITHTIYSAIETDTMASNSGSRTNTALSTVPASRRRNNDETPQPERGRSRTVSKPSPPVPQTPVRIFSGNVAPPNSGTRGLDPYVSPRIEKRWGTDLEKKLAKEARLQRVEEDEAERDASSPVTANSTTEILKQPSSSIDAKNNDDPFSDNEERKTELSTAENIERIPTAATFTSNKTFKSELNGGPAELAQAMAEMEINETTLKGVVRRAPSDGYSAADGALHAQYFGNLRVVNGTPEDVEKNGRAVPAPPVCMVGGDAFIVTGNPLPAGSIFGFDIMVMTVKDKVENFGVRDIPFGPHLVFARSDSPMADITGHWFFSRNKRPGTCGDIHVRSWNPLTDTLEEEEVKVNKHFAEKEIVDFHPNLLPYKLADWEGQNKEGVAGMVGLAGSGADDLWKDLTFAIKPAVLERILKMPHNKWRVTSDDGFKQQPINYRSLLGNVDLERVTSTEYNCDGQKPILNLLFDRFDYTTVVYREPKKYSEITAQSLDSTTFIDHLVYNYCTDRDTDDFLGELQFCYLTGMFVGNVVCQEHWCAMVRLIFKAYNMCEKDPVLMARSIMAIHSQLIVDHQYLEGSIFDYNSKFKQELYKLLCKFRTRLDEMYFATDSIGRPKNNNADVRKAFDALEKFLWKWNWDLRTNFVKKGKYMLEDGEMVDAEMSDYNSEDDEGEYAPVIVDLDENGRERGLF